VIRHDATTGTDPDGVTELEAEVTHKNERIEELEAELAEYKQFVGAEFAAVRGRITDVEDQAQTRSQAAESTDTTPEDESPSQSAATPLERICALPEHVADRELTTNQERARFIARDIRDYAEKAPAGLVIDSRAIKRVVDRCRRKTSPHPNCGPRHEFPRRSWTGGRSAEETPREEAHRG
jgi:hypothetical protein